MNATRSARLAAAVVFTLVLAAPATAQRPLVGGASPDSLAADVLRRFVSGTPEAFDSILADPPARAVVRDAAQRSRVRVPGMGRVVWRGRDRAVLLLTGTVTIGSTGDATNAARRFSGLYEAADSAGRWTVGRHLPLDERNRILSHTLDVTLTPGVRAEIIDTVEVTIGAAYGFAARLNPGARLTEVTLDGQPVEHEQGGGMLWLRAAERKRGRLALRYALDLARDSQSAETDSVGPRYGALQNDYAWMLFFDYDAFGDHGPARVTVRVPAAYQLTTTLPQTERVENGVRIVHGESQEQVFVTSILYDRDWHLSSGTVGGMRWETFFTPAFNVPLDSLVAVLRRTHAVLTKHFGEPATKYVGFAEQRSIPFGFRYRANEVVMAGKGGGRVGQLLPAPSASLTHEISHGWTDPAGPGANFLREGWATFAEAMVLKETFGDEVEHAFWEVRRNGYMAGSDGRLGILANPDNGAVHYSKGSWILRMLRDHLGEPAFDRGMREWMAEAAARPTDYVRWMAIMSHASGQDVKPFLMPWLDGTIAPDLDARVDGPRVIVSQTGPLFDLRLGLALTTPSGVVRRTLHLTRRSDTLDVASLGAVTAVRVDPDGRLLLERHMGEVVRFEVRADSAKQVGLAGDFAARVIPATRQGDVWVVEIPMVEGRYYWTWVIDGKSKESAGEPWEGVRLVQPMTRLEHPYPSARDHF